MDNVINITVDGTAFMEKKEVTILELCKKHNIHIPTLCYHPDLKIIGSCRLCIVEIENHKKLEAACSTPICSGMIIYTNSTKVRHARKMILELLLADHYTDCTECNRNMKCELQSLAEEYDVTNIPWTQKRERTIKIDSSSEVFERDNDKCILCGRCVEACDQLQGVHAIDKVHKGKDITIASFFEKPIADIVCINCGQCVAHCPTAALVEKSHKKNVFEALEDPDKTVIIQTAPAIRAALGELFNQPPGTRVTGKMVTALKKMGFNYVFDTQFTADLTIIEEGYELLNRLTESIKFGKESALPMTTSCSPGWIKYQEHFFPELLPHLSTCKSPQQMMGALLKTYWAKKMNILPKDIVSVSVMPCTAKKFEASRKEMRDSGYRDVDYVLTTRELGSMIKQCGLSLEKLDDGEFDHPLGESTGAGTIFGATGGVMEAALRTAYEIITGREIPFEHLDVVPVRGMESVKEAQIKIEGTLPEWNFLENIVLKIAVAYGTANAGLLMNNILTYKKDYHFIEIMTCPGGCLGGGGQPLPSTPEIRKKRAEAIYNEDHSLPIRKSHQNPAVIKLYEDFLGKPNSDLAHSLLHTKYTARGRY